MTDVITPGMGPVARCDPAVGIDAADGGERRFRGLAGWIGWGFCVGIGKLDVGASGAVGAARRAACCCAGGRLE